MMWLRLVLLGVVLVGLSGCALALMGTALNAAGATHEHNPGFNRERAPAVDAGSVPESGLTAR